MDKQKEGWSIDEGPFAKCALCGGVVEKDELSKGICPQCVLFDKMGSFSQREVETFVDCDCETCLEVAKLIQVVDAVIDRFILRLEKIDAPPVMGEIAYRARCIVSQSALVRSFSSADVCGHAQAISKLFEHRLLRGMAGKFSGQPGGERSLVVGPLSPGDVEGMPKEIKEELRKACREAGAPLPPGLDDDEGGGHGHLH